jgi:hypothetical protein
MTVPEDSGLDAEVLFAAGRLARDLLVRLALRAAYGLTRQLEQTTYDLRVRLDDFVRHSGLAHAQPLSCDCGTDVVAVPVSATFWSGRCPSCRAIVGKHL